MKGQKKQEAMRDKWNQTVPVGTPVTRFKLINPLRCPESTRTRSAAWLVGGHTAMVQVEGIAGGVVLSSLALRELLPKKRVKKRHLLRCAECGSTNLGGNEGGYSCHACGSNDQDE